MTAEDLAIIEQAGRRCAGCHTGRHWRRFEVLRPEGREPLVACPACRPRLSALAAKPPEPPAPTPEAEKPSAPARPRRQRRPQPQREDRLKRALRELPPGAHSTGRIARAAGLNETKVLARLRALEEAGEVQRLGKLWSNERPSTDLEAALDRLQSRTNNLRIVRPRDRVG